MKNKPRDILMCNVREYAVTEAEISIPLERLTLFRDFLYNRYTIHLLKDYYKSTDLYSFIEDNRIKEIFSRYKFCNIRREQDRCSRWLIDNISNSGSLKENIVRSILFRIYNNIHTAELIDLKSSPVCGGEERFLNYLNKAEELMQPDGKSYYKYFTDAYSTTGMKASINKSYDRPLPVCPIMLARDIYKNGFADELISCESQDKVFNKLKELPGISHFMAYQLFVDLTYINDFQFSENEFVVSGPGCNFGLRTLLGEENRKTIELTDEEILFWLRDNLLDRFKENNIELDLNKLFIDLPEYDRCLNVMMLENCFCEFQKFYRALDENENNPRVRYKPFDTKRRWLI